MKNEKESPMALIKRAFQEVLKKEEKKKSNLH